MDDACSDTQLMLINILRRYKVWETRWHIKNVNKTQTNLVDWYNDITVINTDVTKDLSPRYIFCQCNRSHLTPICPYLLRYIAKVTQFPNIWSFLCVHISNIYKNPENWQKLFLSVDWKKVSKIRITRICR